MYYQHVPQTLDANIAYRIAMRERAVTDMGFRRAMWQACRDDVLFFFSAFCWLYEPRPRFDAAGHKLPKMIPFIPWEHQIPAIQEMRQNLGTSDIVVFKSRGEGLSWIGILLALHDWLFDDMAKVGVVSNTEKKADDPGNMDSIGAKLDWELTKLPLWMAGEPKIHWTRNLADHSWVNLRNQSQINAFAATADAGRAGRYKWFLADELAFWDRGKDREFLEAIRESTESRLAISTPNGSSGAFYDMVHNPSSVVRIRVHWSQNPYKNRGLYRLVKGIPVAEPGHALTKGYDPPSNAVRDRWLRLRAKGFKLEGQPRSPWYDAQCDRADATPQSIAQELDLDFGGSMFRVFSAEFFDKAKSTLMGPQVVGKLSYHPETLEPEFIEGVNGDFKLWCQLDANGNPPRRDYAIGGDISSGLGGSHTSNSVLEIIDLLNMEQIGQFTSNTVEEGEFGELAVVVAKWFHNAYLGWEMNFGGGFTKRVLRLGYGNIYMRDVLWKRSKKKTKEVGWNTNPRSKELMFSDLHRMVKTGEFTIRDADLFRELGEYVRSGPQSEIEHVLSTKNTKSTTDKSSMGKAHGDRVIAMCVALQVAKDRPADTMSGDANPVGPPPVNTLAWRVEQWRLEDEASRDSWDDRTTGDLARG